MKRFLLAICTMLTLCFLFSCGKSKMGVCEHVFIEGQGQSTVSRFWSEPTEPENCSTEPSLVKNFTFPNGPTTIESVERQKYWENKSSRKVGYSKKIKTPTGWFFINDVVYINEDGEDQPGRNSEFLELKSEIQKLKGGAYTNVSQVQFHGKSITIQ